MPKVGSLQADRDKNKNDELQKASEDAAAPKKIQSDPLSGRYPCPAGCGRTFSHPPAAVQHGKVCGKPKKKKKKAHEFLAEMKAKYEKDPEGVAAQFKALIDDESTRPAIEAIIKHGMCECAGAHANLCAWILMMWIAATRFRMEHRDAAPERLASMDDEAKTAYLVDACVEIKVYDVFGFTDLCTGEKHEADPEVRWRRRGAVRNGRFRRVAHDGGLAVAAGA